MNGTLSYFDIAIYLTNFRFEPHSDFNFIRQGTECVAVGPEPIPAGICNADDPNQTYKGSSGWRKVPGNTCEGGMKKDEKVDRKCSMGRFYFLVQVSGTIEG